MVSWRVPIPEFRVNFDVAQMLLFGFGGGGVSELYAVRGGSEESGCMTVLPCSVTQVYFSVQDNRVRVRLVAMLTALNTWAGQSVGELGVWNHLLFCLQWSSL